MDVILLWWVYLYILKSKKKLELSPIFSNKKSSPFPRGMFNKISSPMGWHKSSTLNYDKSIITKATFDGVMVCCPPFCCPSAFNWICSVLEPKINLSHAFSINYYKYFFFVFFSWLVFETVLLVLIFLFIQNLRDRIYYSFSLCHLW